MNFYPRPPRGGRPHPHRIPPRPREISIHALREEGDKVSIGDAEKAWAFLSTPSARRATRYTPHPASWLNRFLSTPSARRATP